VSHGLLRRARARLQKRKRIELFPIHLDDTVKDTKEAWAAKLCANRRLHVLERPRMSSPRAFDSRRESVAGTLSVHQVESLFFAL
jgi:hypothetical protein